MFRWSMIFSENRYPPRIKSGAGFFGIMLWSAPLSVPRDAAGLGILSPAHRRRGRNML
jgi:hypothetical protein